MAISELWGIWCLRCRQLLEGMILIKKILTIDIGYESLVKIFLFQLYICKYGLFPPRTLRLPLLNRIALMEVNPLIRYRTNLTKSLTSWSLMSSVRCKSCRCCRCGLVHCRYRWWNCCLSGYSKSLTNWKSRPAWKWSCCSRFQESERLCPTKNHLTSWSCWNFPVQ